MTVHASDLESLVERCRSGNNHAQHTLYNRYAKAMYNVSLRIVGNSVEAEDVIQLAFIQVFKSLNELKSNKLFSSWLKRIVVNRSIDQLRKKDKLDIVSLDDEMTFSQIPQETFHFSHQNQESNLIEEIKTGIDRLADGYRTILSLYLLEGYDHSEIAAILGIAESTSRTQYMRAKIKLRSIISEG